MTDITPDIPEGRQIIQGYGDGRFRISDTVHHGSVVILRDRTLEWRVPNFEDIDAAAFGPVIAEAHLIELLIVGCGAKFRRIAPEILSEIRRSGIAVEVMDTGAACRTFNLLAIDGRRVAAALVAVD